MKEYLASMPIMFQSECKRFWDLFARIPSQLWSERLSPRSAMEAWMREALATTRWFPPPFPRWFFPKGVHRWKIIFAYIRPFFKNHKNMKHIILYRHNWSRLCVLVRFAWQTPTICIYSNFGISFSLGDFLLNFIKEFPDDFFPNGVHWSHVKVYIFPLLFVHFLKHKNMWHKWSRACFFRWVLFFKCHLYLFQSLIVSIRIDSPQRERQKFELRYTPMMFHVFIQNLAII